MIDTYIGVDLDRSPTSVLAVTINNKTFKIYFNVKEYRRVVRNRRANGYATELNTHLEV